MGDMVQSLFGGGAANGYAAAGNQLSQIPAMLEQYLHQATGYMQPYYDAGTQQLGNYTNAINAMQDPQAFYQKMMQGYSMSPQAKLQEEQGIRAANAGAAASGMVGSGAQQKALTDYAHRLTEADQDNYYNKMMGINNNYLSGLGQMTGMGMNAGNTMGNWAMGTGNAMTNAYNNMASNAYNQTAARGSGIGSLVNQGLGMLGTMAFL